MTLLLLLACMAKDAPSTPGTDAGDPDGGGGGTTATDDGGSDGGATGLIGSAPAKAIPAPEFVATNRDGTGRSREDLLGHPTVIWFYPAASTAG
jgi:hypothetical protein